MKNVLILIGLSLMIFGCKSNEDDTSTIKANIDSTLDIEITHNTVFKKTTAQSSTLSADQKCNFVKGTKLRGKTYQVNEKGHWQVNLVSSTCHFSKGYFFLGHIKAEGAEKSLQNPQRIATSSGRVGSSGSPRSAVLSMIGWAEGTTTVRGSDDGYNVKFGGSLFQSYAKFPPGCVRFGGGNCSTAAGRYQFLDHVWAEVMGRGASIYPAEQDRAAVKRMKTMRRFHSADQKLSYSQFLVMLDKLSCEWASLPNSKGRSCYPGQPKKGISALWAKYQSNQ